MEIKANIPSKSAGRLLDALTDAIRPFTEKQGLRADQIRLQREDVLLEIAKKARERLAIEEVDRIAISNKFLVPFLEKASLEDGSSELTDWWAALLVSAAKSSDAQKPIYVDILSKLERGDAQFLERLWKAKTEAGDTWLYGSEVSSRLERELSAKVLQQGRRDSDEEWVTSLQGVLITLQRDWATRGCIAEQMNYPTAKGRASLAFPPIAEPADTSVGLGLLLRSRLSWPIPTPWIGEFDVSAEFLMLSRLGDQFLKACHGALE